MKNYQLILKESLKTKNAYSHQKDLFLLRDWKERKKRGKNGIIGKQFKPIKIWQKYSDKKVLGVAVKSGHFIPEQNPKETIKQLKSFFLKNV